MPTDAPFAWDDLLEYIEDRKVIPILGPELLRVTIDGREMLWQHWAALKLAERLRVPLENLPEEHCLNAVVCRYLQGGGQREDVYSRMRSAIKDAKLAIPEPLRKLAQIHHFTLYVSTTFDSLLAQALIEVRGPSAAVQSIAYSPNNVQDLPSAVQKLTSPTVFHLFGRLSASPDYVVTEADLLEFLCALPEDNKRPRLLLDALRDHHLLLIGCNFPGWLARFFIRMAKGAPLWVQRPASEILADQLDRQDPNLVLFLQHFSYRTRIFPDGGALEFVNELWSRYRLQHPPEKAVGPSPSPVGEVSPDMVSGAVFLSYASEDLAAAQRVRDALAEAGIDVWFDKAMLQLGDAWNAKIKRNITNCSLFLPLISVNTQGRLEGYFRLEWRWAAERSLQIADGVPFILPIQIEDVAMAAAVVPEKFMELQWTKLSSGQTTPEFVRRIVQLYREYRRREKGLT